MITYNHENYIAQAIESVLMQQTTFDYELVIGEDCSSDKTREIILAIQERYPNKIRLLQSDRNLGMHKNYERTYAACEGQYVALLEGDDYWTASDKLQSQVNFLEARADCVICFHPVIAFYEKDAKQPSYVWPPEAKAISNIEDIIRSNYIPTCSVMFRNRLIDNYPDWINSMKIRDWLLHILHSQYGNIGCLDKIMAAYRIHPQGVWSSLDDKAVNYTLVRFYELVNAHFKGKYKKIIRPILSERLYNLAIIYDRMGECRAARHFLLRSLSLRVLSGGRVREEHIRFLTRLTAPHIYSITKKLSNLLAS
jgi:glycosyltransferase involved in cell wall biosynthesis